MEELGGRRKGRQPAALIFIIVRIRDVLVILIMDIKGIEEK